MRVEISKYTDFHSSNAFGIVLIPTIIIRKEKDYKSKSYGIGKANITVLSISVSFLMFIGKLSIRLGDN